MIEREQVEVTSGGWEGRGESAEKSTMGQNLRVNQGERGARSS